jgi:hypothetical protein
MPTVQFTDLAGLTAIVAHFDQHPNAGLAFVHDDGIYLMPTNPTIPGQNRSNWVVYAKDCNPNTDTDWYDTARGLVGGDDFGENITPAIHVIRACVKDGRGFSIKVSPTSLTFNTGRKLPKSAKVG